MNKFKLEIKWALFFTIMSLLWMLLERLLGLHDVHIEKHAIYTNFIAIPSILIYVLALFDKRKNYFKGTLSYKQGFICGLIITFIITLLVPLSQYITSTIITPNYFSNAINYAVENELMSKDDAMQFFNLKNYIIQGLIGAPIMGFLTTAIVAIFTRKKLESGVN